MDISRPDNVLPDRRARPRYTAHTHRDVLGEGVDADQAQLRVAGSEDVLDAESPGNGSALLVSGRPPIAQRRSRTG
ncbi:hypothetical protein ACLQ28_31535 [Micromonospora sp. DT201]|uniref:hypothetical protein n=1 Tax=Micromonospora sp. DT201 TaxID=3393442 RepID=UPI003CF504C1